MTRAPSTFTCTVTPFDAAGRLDLEAWRSHLVRLAASGMGVYVGSSSPGEGYTLDADETEALYGAAVDAVGADVSVRAMGVETHTALDYLELVRIAEATGMQAMQLYCVDSGHANIPTERELECYFRTILDGSTIDCVVSSHIYNGYVVPLPVLDRLLVDYGDRIRGINVTNPDVRYVSALVDVVDDRCDVHVGGPMQALTILALGGQGFLSTDGNIIPATCVDVVRSHANGDLRASQAAFRDVLRFFSANRWPGGSMRYLKTVMRVLGLPGHHLRPPFLELGDDGCSEVEAILGALDIDELSGLRGAGE